MSECENCVHLTIENLELSNANIDAELYHNKRMKEWSELTAQLIDLAKELSKGPCCYCEESRKREDEDNFIYDVNGYFVGVRQKREEVEDSNGSVSEA